MKHADVSKDNTVYRTFSMKYTSRFDIDSTLMRFKIARSDDLLSQTIKMCYIIDR